MNQRNLFGYDAHAVMAAIEEICRMPIAVA